MKKVKRPFDCLEEVNWEEKLAQLNPTGTINTISALEDIVTLATNSKLSQEFWQYAEPYTTYIAQKQNISNMQAVLLALITNASTDDTRVQLSNIAGILDCNNLSLMKYQSELDDLIHRGFIIYMSRNNYRTGYCTAPKAIKALAADKTYQRPSVANAEGTMLFRHFFNITHRLFQDELSHAFMLIEAEELFKANLDHPYLKALEKYDLDLQDNVVITSFCRHLVFDGGDSLPACNYLYLYEDTNNFDTIVDLSPNLIKKGLIQHSCNDGMADGDEFCLTPLAREDLLKGFNIKSNPTNCHMQVIENSDIKQKQLFFNKPTTIQYNELADLLSEEHYRDIRKRLSDKGMRCGFTCLFYGAPGTGKTEMALQLARITGRDIMQVNISEMKSMWVGQSEKNVKSLFDRYRGMVQQSKVTPILLFNEADAIISKRSSNVERAVDKMENSIQNIILQEMETLDGIMIATTNLEQNLDAAFERRFLYKMRFEKPDIPQRQAIWRSMLPHLEPQVIEPLAAKYDFSGGQIENISRKLEIDSILYGPEQSLLKLEQFCKDEVLNRRNTRPIGFVS